MRRIQGDRAREPSAHRAHGAGVDVSRARAWAGRFRVQGGAVQDLRHARPQLQLRLACACAGGDDGRRFGCQPTGLQQATEGAVGINSAPGCAPCLFFVVGSFTVTRKVARAQGV